MSKLETAMAIIMGVFDQYAASEGDKNTLSKAEMKCLLLKELPGLMKAAKSKDQVDQLLQTLDFDGDSKIDFKEFAMMVISFTCAIHNK